MHDILSILLSEQNASIYSMSKALWYRAACLLIQKKMDVLDTTYGGLDNTL